MICVQSSFIKELDELVNDVHATSNEFQHQIYHSKCQVTKLVREQIQRFKGRNDLIPNGGLQTRSNSYPINQADVATDPLIDYHPLSNSTTDIDDIDLAESRLSGQALESDIVDQRFAEAKTYQKISEVPESRLFGQALGHDNVQAISGEKMSESPRQSRLLDRDVQNLQLSALIPEDQVTTRNFIHQQLEVFRRMPRLLKTAKRIISALVIGFLIWISLVYGAILGASMCSNGYCFLSSSRRPTVF